MFRDWSVLLLERAAVGIAGLPAVQRVSSIQRLNMPTETSG